MLESLALKLAGGALGLATLAGAVTWEVHLIHDRSALREWQSDVLTHTKNASQNPKLVVKDVPAQIDSMGGAILNFKNHIVVQNKAVDDLKTKRDEALAARDREAALRKEVISKSQSLAQQLRNEALTPVERSNLEAELRRVQDMAWEAGL